MKFVLEWEKRWNETQGGPVDMSELCGKYGISRPSRYAWVKRYLCAFWGGHQAGGEVRGEARVRKGTPEATVLKGSRWAPLKAPERHIDEDRLRLAEVSRLNRRVYNAYLLKEELRALYRCGPRAAKQHLRAWLAWASRPLLAPFVRLARTLRKYRDGILAAIELGVSN